MEYYNISCINYCSFVNIYKCFIPKERTMFGDGFNTEKSLHFRLNL